MRLKYGLPLACVASLALAPAAAATITKTHVTTPAKSPSYFISKNSNTFKVKGTTNSSSPSTDQVDIRCFYGSNQSALVQSGVSLHSNGSFSVPAAPLSSVKDKECRLRAVPHGVTTPSSSYTGPWLDVGEQSTARVPGGPNAGTTFNYYYWGQQTALGNDYYSLGYCGLCDSYLFNRAGALTATVFYANAYLWWQDGSPSTRSELKVDGRDAYPPGVESSFFTGAQNVPGLPKLTYKAVQNNKNGNVTITETDPLFRCNGTDSYPPTQTSCTSYKSTGVEAHRTIVQSASGHVVSITDSYKSTNGRAHKIDLLYENDQCLGPGTGSPCSGSTVGYRFAGHHSYAAHTLGDVVHVPHGVGTVYMKVLGAPDGDHATGQGAITYAQAPTKIVFISSGSISELTMHYAAKVPAKGTVTYRFAYATAYTSAQVHHYAAAAQRALKK
jgi:hypothetical protein